MSDLRATYRLQLGPEQTLADAARLVPYLEKLGVSHLYLSPVWAARPGSTHGYDVVDPTAVSDALGGAEALRRLAARGLGLILDVVPNHMAVDEEANLFWRDPLWRAKFFDLDWRTAAHRRFFDVSELAGVRQEDPEVFEATHRTLVELVRQGAVEGVRVDHVDGLAEPRRYLERLREAGVERVWVEKILEPGEPLRQWPVEGTTGYDFLADTTALWLDPSLEPTLDRIHRERTGETRTFSEVAEEARRELTRGSLEEDVDRLARLLAHEPLSGEDVRDALARLPVYRTYVDPYTGLVDELDREAVHAARMHPRLAELLLLERRGADAFVVRFQQTSPPVRAKGVEDTAFYRWSRLLALNEVGSDPARFSLGVDGFHAACLDRAARRPHELLATTTHDAKRSADVRARLVALAGAHEAWERLLDLASASARSTGDPAAEYPLLQTLVGAWPIGGERLSGYVVKALREEKRGSSWASPDEAWEAEVIRWAGELLSAPSFVAALEELVDALAGEEQRVLLGQRVLQLTAPGIPDTYQGDELPFRALVDPDNRRAPDWTAARRGLRFASPATTKQGVIRELLRLRRERPAAFAGAYEPVAVDEHVVAYLRGREVLVAVALRGELGTLPRLTGIWDDVLPVHPHRRVLARRR